MTRAELVARALAAAFVAGVWTERALLARGREALGDGVRWLPGVAQRAYAAFSEPSLPDLEVVAAHIGDDDGFRRAADRRHRRGRLLSAPRRWFITHPTMRPERAFDVPDLPTSRALARWLGLSVADLGWFADPHGLLLGAPSGPLQHYHALWRPKADGTKRLLEVPKATLKALQRRVLHGLLDRVPPHDAAHGFRPRRSVLSFVAPHCGQHVVLRMDLREFFPSVGGARVAALFKGLGSPPAVARALTGLVTTRTPARIRADLGPSGRRYRDRHLPQGAPTSPALANLCAYGLDVRLRAAARAVGAEYTRYADDLAFSGPRSFGAQLRRFQILVARIALEEGFEVNTRKTRAMRHGTRQKLCGLVVNDRPAVARADYDTLKATLHNCVRHGPASQNRADVGDFAAHLRGRVAWFEHVSPTRGGRLRALLDAIAWS